MNKITENKKQKKNLATIKTQKQKLHDEIKQMREKINKHLDILEQQILQDLSAQEEHAKLQIENILTKVFENTEKIDMLQNNITTVKQYASDLQTFLGTKTIQDEVQRQEKTLQTIFDDGYVNEVSLKCNLDDKITEILCTISSFGKVSIEQGPPSVVIKMDKDKQAQIGSKIPAQAKTIHDIKLVVQWKINTKEKDRMTMIVGACINTSTGDIVLTDYQNGLLFLNKDGYIHKKIPLSFSYPAYVTFIDDRSVAVSNHESYCINIIYIRDNASKRTIKTTNCCSGVSYRHGLLLYAEHKKGICKVELPNSGKTLLIPKRADNSWDYLTMSDDKIYHTMHEQDKVCCYTMSGEKIWEYNDTTILKEPIGVSFDKSSNIYVVSNGNNTIIVISSGGNFARCIFGKEERIDRPCGICIDIKRNNLVVSIFDGTVVLYKLT